MLAFYWQIVTFVLVVIPLGPAFITIICSKYSMIKLRFYDLFKIYLSFLIIFGFYPLINLFLAYINIDPVIRIKFRENYIFVIQVGQIIQGIIISFISLMVIYELYRTKLGTFLATLLLSLSFIFIGGIYPRYIHIIGNFFFNSTFSIRGVEFGRPFQLFYIFLWTTENFLEILIIIIVYIAYILQNGKNFQQQLIWLKSYSAGLFILLPVIGYIISNSFINIIEIGALIVSVFLIWSLIRLLEIFFEKKSQKYRYKSNFEMCFLIYFLLTLSFSLALLVSFSAALFLSLMLISGLIYLYMQHIKLPKLITKLIFGLICGFAIMIGATPTAFSFFTIDDISIFLNFLIQYDLLEQSIDPQILFLGLNLAPIQLPSLEIIMYSVAIGLIIALFKEIISIEFEKSIPKKNNLSNI
ncbi:MAG: hypothetical protein ACFFDN_40880 [Candidatus Hodarchaeota archaeon]